MTAAPDKHIPVTCAIESGDLTLHEHADIKWLMPEELHTLDWADADE